MLLNDYLKALFGDKQTMTLEELTAAAAANKTAKFVDLQEGGYVAAQKFNDSQIALSTANNTIKSLQDAAKKFDGVDVAKLQKDFADLQTKYNTDTAALKLSSALESALLAKKAKNPKAVKALLNMDEIKLDGDKLLGLDSQLEAITKSDAYLFGDETPAQNQQQGQQNQQVSSSGVHGTSVNVNYDAMSDDEYYSTVLKKGDNK